MVIRVITSFAEMRDDELATRANNVIEKMTGNPNFTTPAPALADVTTALAEFRQALEQGQLGGKDKTVVKYAKRLVLERLLRPLALYVESNCKDDLAILLGSGFDARKTPAPRGTVLEKPTNFSLTSGPYPGSITLSVDKVPGAGSYLFEYATTPVGDATQWQKVAVGARNYTVEGLTSGLQYAFRVTGVNRSAKPLYSDVISSYIL